MGANAGRLTVVEWMSNTEKRTIMMTKLDIGKIENVILTAYKLLSTASIPNPSKAWDSSVRQHFGLQLELVDPSCPYKTAFIALFQSGKLKCFPQKLNSEGEDRDIRFIHFITAHLDDKLAICDDDFCDEDRQKVAVIEALHRSKKLA